MKRIFRTAFVCSIILSAVGGEAFATDKSLRDPSVPEPNLQEEGEAARTWTNFDQAADPVARSDDTVISSREYSRRTAEHPLWENLELFSDKGRVFEPLLADPREAQFRMGFLRETKAGETNWDLVFGGDLGLARATLSDTEDISLTVRGLVVPRFEFGSDSFDLLNTDFIGGAAIGYRRGNDSFEAFLYHESSHLGDEVLERKDRDRIDYSYEAFRFLWAHQFDDLRIYGGPTYKFSAEPDALDGKTTIQLGAEYKFNIRNLPMYWAADVQSKEEHNWEPNVATQVGFDLGDSARIYRQQRVFIEYFHGFSNMGQFYDERERYILVGVAYDPTPPYRQTAASTADDSLGSEKPLWESLELFSDKGRVFEPLLADPREAQFRMGFLRETKAGETNWDLVFGGDLGLARARLSDTEEISLTVRGLVAPRFDFGSDSFDLLNVDFIGGAALGYRRGNDSFEAFLHHESSHLGDEILDREDRDRIDFSYEAFRFLWARQFDDLRIYGGPTYKFSAEPDELDGKTTIQLGAEYEFSIRNLPMYWAADVQSKEEHNWEPNVATQVGFNLGDSARIYRQQRVFVEYFHGFSNMGQFYDERERYILVGLAFIL